MSVEGSKRPRSTRVRATGRERVQHRQTGKASDPHEALRVHVRLATCYNLLMREARNRVGDHWNLTLPQFDVLAELARAERHGFTFIELSRLLLVTSGNLTGIVDRLEARQLVRRVPDDQDRRVVRVALTEKGRSMTRQMLPRHAEDLAQVLAFMSPDALKRLSDLLDQVKHGLSGAAAK